MELYDDNGTKTKPARRVNLLLAGLVYATLGGIIGAFIFYLASGTGARVATLQVAPPAQYAGTVEEAGSIAWVAQSASPSVFEVTTENTATHPIFGSFIESGAGSAVVISENGYLLTNNHVVAGASTIRVRSANGDAYDAEVIGTDAAADIAVLKIDATGLVPVVFADSDTVRVGELAVAIGNPLGTLGGSVTEGIVSAKDRTVTVDDESMVLLQTSAAISPGNSGGGLFNGLGQLIGIVTLKSSAANVEGLGFAVPSNLARETAEQIIQHGYVTGRPALGVVAENISKRSDLTRYGLSKSGLYVINVMKDSKLKLWDLIVSVNDTELTSQSELKSVLSGMKAGETVWVEIFRDGAYQTLELKLYERTPEMTSAGVI